jgi:type IV secretory pathway component VirB8
VEDQTDKIALIEETSGSKPAKWLIFGVAFAILVGAAAAVVIFLKLKSTDAN